jgi:hypothetical protein
VHQPELSEFQRMPRLRVEPNMKSWRTFEFLLMPRKDAEAQSRAEGKAADLPRSRNKLLHKLL